LASLLLLSVTGACRAPGGSPRSGRPDVLVLVIDALRADRLGFDGYARPTSPALDALARESVHFRNAFAQATWTKPSIGSLFASRYPSELGLLDLDFQEDPSSTSALTSSLPLLAESFAAGGWRTGAVINQVHLSRTNGFARGFADFRHFRSRNANQLNHQVADFVDGLNGRPFFAYVHYLDVHWPYDEVPRWLRKSFGPISLEVRPPRDLAAFTAWQKQHLDAHSIEVLSNRYDAGIRRTDRSVGQLIDILKRAGRWENTIVAVTADHGEGFFEHHEMLHGFTPYIEVARVPLLLRVPERFRATSGERATPVGLIDLAPTLLDLAGAPSLEGARGRSLRSLLEGREEPARLELTQSAQGWSLRDARYTLIASPGPKLEFFDRSSDPEERHPLDAERCGEPCSRLASTMRRLQAELGAAVAPGERNPLTPAEIEELRALGYI